MSTLKHSLPIFSREIRLGLVLYGGISLAIYMNGICQEFYNAVRGRGIYKLIKALTDSDIVIDIVSGTSAGGVNGVLLSYAIANSGQDAVIDFKDFVDLWIDKGDIKKLSRKIFTKSKSLCDSIKSLFYSVLDGEDFYQNELEKAFKEETKYSPEDDWYSEFKELDLFITATDLNGRLNKVFDNTGKVIEIKDHRAVFHLQYRQDQIAYIDNPFKPEEITRKALAKLCRMTSCFPVAFPVVEVNLHSRDEDPDYKLVTWGKLYNRELNNKEQEHLLSFVDGGVLNNRPFSSTVQTIYARTAYRPTDRKLFYIDPSPDQFANNANQGAILSKPRKNPFKVAYDSKIEIPNYQSISKDLECIKEGNRKVIRHQLLKQVLEQKNATQQIEFLTANERKNKDNYDNIEYANYLKCRFLGLLDNSIKQILVSTDRKSENYEFFLHEAAKLLNQSMLSRKAEEHLNNEQLRHICSEIAPLDITFYIRKHCFLLEVISTIVQSFQKENNIKQYLEMRYLAYQLTWQLELLYLIQKALNRILSEYDFDEIIDEEKAGESQFEKLYNFLRVFHKTLLATESNNHESLTIIHDTLLDIGNDAFLKFRHDSLFEMRNDFYPEHENMEKSSEEILKTYYELFKVINFPADINFDEHPINWSALNILLPEQETSLAKKIFALIYEMPVCQALTVKTSKQRRREIGKCKTKIRQQLTNKHNSNYLEDEQGSILEIIDEHSKQLIDNISIDADEKVKLTSYFKYFEVIDTLLYPYEYLSDIITKNTIDLVRVSPNDANEFGFGKGKEIQTKLRGRELGAFGGFFKKAWRSNDILWGRLDGLDRIVTALITPQSLKNFLQFHKKYQGNLNIQDYLGYLVCETLPMATDDERTAIVNYLQCITLDSNCDSSHSQQEFKLFLDLVVKSGQRQILLEDILSKDLDNTAEIMNFGNRKYTKKISAFKKFLKEFKEKLHEKKLDDDLIKQLDDYFEEYQNIKKSPKYKQMPLNVLKVMLVTLVILMFWGIGQILQMSLNVLKVMRSQYLSR